MITYAAVICTSPFGPVPGRATCWVSFAVPLTAARLTGTWLAEAEAAFYPDHKAPYIAHVNVHWQGTPLLAGGQVSSVAGRRTTRSRLCYA